jgi:hypothetical protein
MKCVRNKRQRASGVIQKATLPVNLHWLRQRCRAPASLTECRLNIAYAAVSSPRRQHTSGSMPPLPANARGFPHEIWVPDYLRGVLLC